MVEHLSDRVATMSLGTIGEIASRDEVYTDARHRYTRALLAAVSVPDPLRRAERPPLRGDFPSPLSPPPPLSETARAGRGRLAHSQT